MYLLERQLGAACAIPIGIAVLSLLGSIAATSMVMQRQALWLEGIERRIAATSAMLSSMKGVKMGGLTEVLREDLHKLRIDELNISKKFRKLLIWTMGFSKPSSGSTYASSANHEQHTFPPLHLPFLRSQSSQ